MGVEAFSLPEVMIEEVNALVRSGIYSSKSDVARDAFRCLLEHKPELRTNAAIELYKEEKVSLGRAAEIAGTDFESFKNILADRGIKLKTYMGPKKEMEKQMKLLKNLRK